MAHYAVLDENNVVIFIHPGKNENEDGVNWEEYYNAVRTSYNTHGGQHSKGGIPFRYNYAGIGFTFDPDFGADGAFIPPKPHPSWTLDSSTALWNAPKSYPEDGGPWRWNEELGNWEELPPQPVEQ